MAAKKNSNNDSQKIIFVAAALALVYVVIVNSGQLTGQAIFNGTIEVDVESVLTCNIEYGGDSAWTTGAAGENISCTKSAGATNSQCGNVINVTNSGSVEMTVNLTIVSDADGFFAQSELDLDGVDITSVEVNNVIWTVPADSADTGDFWLVTVASTEAAGEYDIVFNLECDFA